MVMQEGQASYEGLSKRGLEILRLLAEGLSDREIAERLVMTVNTVKWYNRQIYSILGVGGRTQAIVRARELQLLDGEQSSTPPSTTSTTSTNGRRPHRHNLPVETTRFIGRQQELEAIKRLLESVRLLTLVGPPGTGKTRLALHTAWEIASTQAERFRDGVYFVSLAPISDPALVVNTIATAIGINEAPGQPLLETLKQVLRESRILLILDNFEHLLPAAMELSELLAAAPQLKVLATSREPLHLYGEQEYAVPPLGLPDPVHVELEALAACESVALFLQQAQAVRPDFALTAENALDIARICVRLEGLPLAIELAAARIKLLPPRILLARLANPLDTLKGGASNLPARHQTLQNTIEWSYNLLNESEKLIFTRLAVFRGGHSLEAIEAICTDQLTIDLFDGLESLVNKSLIQQTELPNGEPRFTMLETLHTYAWQQLLASGEAEEMSRRHAAYFVELAERAGPELRQAHSRYWFHLLETEHENMRAVLHWSLHEGDVTLGVRLGGALALFWYAFGHHVEGRHWTQQLLERLGEVEIRYHPKLLLSAGQLTMLYDLETAQDYFGRALQLSRQLDDHLHAAWSLIYLGYTMMREQEVAMATAEEGLALFRELNHKPGIAHALNMIGEIASFSGDDKRAREAYEACLAVALETGEMRRIRFMFGNLTFVAQREGDYERAKTLATRGLQIALELDSNLDIAEALADLAGPIGLTGQPERAARLFGAWEAALERIGAKPQPADMPEFERNIATIRAALAPAVFEAAWQDGRSLSLEQAVALALEDSPGGD